MKKAIMLVLTLVMISALAIPVFAAGETDFYGNETVAQSEDAADNGEEGFSRPAQIAVGIVYLVIFFIIAFPYHKHLERKGSFNYYAMEPAEQHRLRTQGIKFVYHPFRGGFTFAIFMVFLNYAVNRWGTGWEFLPDWYWDINHAPWFVALLILPGYAMMMITLQSRAKCTKTTITHMIIMGILFVLISLIPMIGLTTAVLMWLVRFIISWNYQEPGLAEVDNLSWNEKRDKFGYIHKQQGDGSWRNTGSKSK
jgi:hypothetical protein